MSTAGALRGMERSEIRMSTAGALRGMERSGIRMSTAEACRGDSKAGGTIDAVVDIKIKLLREKLWQNLGEGTDGEDKGCALKDAREVRRYIICQFSVI